MVDNDFRLGQLLCSRLCHDLIGPAGGVAAGIEFARTDPDDVEAMALLSASARQMAQRLAFFRIAFGLGTGFTGSLTLNDARTLAAGFLDGGRVSLDWHGSVAICGNLKQPASVELVRLLLVTVLVSASALPRGGTLEVDVAKPPPGLTITVTARGDGIRLEDPLTEAMDPEAAVSEVTARTVHGYYMARLVRELNGTAMIENGSPRELRIHVCLPASQALRPVSHQARVAGASHRLR